MSIQNSSPKEANEITSVLRRSILELCGPDYNNDQTILEEWVENKTEENIKSWIESENTIAVTGYLNSSVVGFGLASLKGEVLLMYVLPEQKGKGYGASIYRSIETQLKTQNVNRVIAYSTITAKAFYHKMGFTQFDDAIKVGSIDGEFPLEKFIAI